MGEATTQFRIQAIVDGLQGVEALKNAVRQLSNFTQPAAKDLNELRQAATLLGQASNQTERSLQTQVSVLREVRSNVALASKEYKELTLQINAAERSLAKANGSGGGGLKKFGQTAGAVAASGVFGGPEGLIGSGIGAFFGPAGALAGGAIGAQVGQVRQSIGDTAEYAASLGKLQIALRGVSGSSDEYARAQVAISRLSKELNVPVLEATQGFTRLAAAVNGAGGNVNDTEVVFRGISQAIKATGGSAEDVQSALLAMSQVFSKGKVSAEELQGQLGERLPGAVTLFAKATGRTLPQLAKDLQAGTVGLNDLMKFASALSEKYEKDATKMAKSTEDAGARMQTSLDKLKLAFGNFFKPVGAQIQNFIGQVADLTTKMFAMATTSEKLENFRRQARIDVNNKYKLGGSQETPFMPKEYYDDIETRYNQLVKQSLAANAIKPKPKKLTTFEEVAGSSTASDAAAKKALRDQSELNRLIQENLRLNVESGTVGKDKLSQLDAELELAKRLTRYKIEDARLTSDNEKVRQQKIINVTAEFQKEKARIAKERSDTLKDISDIGVEAKILQEKFFKKTDKSESPLTRELANINLQIDEAIKNADALLARLNAKGGTSPATVKARASLGNFKANLEEFTPGQKNAMASGNLLTGDITSLRQQIEEMRSAGSELKTLEKLKQKYLGDWDKLDPMLRAQAEALAKQVDSLTKAKQIQDGIAESIGGAIKSGLTALVNGTENWANSLRDIAGNLLRSIADQLLQIMVIAPIVDAIKKIKFAQGGVFENAMVTPFASGGVVDRPTIFPFAKGIGLMGEAGPEAIMPLRRGSDGRLGVAASGNGGGGSNITVNVDAKGSSVQGDGGKGNQLARVIAAAVQDEMIKQKRPGGLLAA